LAEAAALAAGAARVGAELLAVDDDGAGVLGRLDGHGHHARGEGRGVEAVERGPRAGAAGVEGQDLGPLAVRAAQGDLEVAERARALGRDGVGDDLVEGAEDGVGDQVADDVAQRTGWGRRALTMVFSGAVTRKGAREPALFGTSGAMAILSA
jgi:hypothetical protein